MNKGHDAWEIYQTLTVEDIRDAAERGVRPQRVLLASTRTKNPDYSDVKYVEPLIGPETVNTLPPETLDAYHDHGAPEARLEAGVAEAKEVLRDLSRLKIDLDEVTRQLEAEGIEKFNKPYDAVMRVLKDKLDGNAAA